MLERHRHAVTQPYDPSKQPLGMQGNNGCLALKKDREILNGELLAYGDGHVNRDGEGKGERSDAVVPPAACVMCGSGKKEAEAPTSFDPLVQL